MNSTHVVNTFVLGPLTKHPDADTLSLFKIGDTDYSYVAKTSEWENHVGKLVCWVPPQNLVDVAIPQFSFLAADAKYNKECVKEPSGIFALVRAKRLRGIVSYGLLVKAPDGVQPGDNAADLLNVVHYEPPELNTKNTYMGGDVESAPPGDFFKYDIDAFMAYARKCFVPNELVCVTEKIHGSNMMVVFTNDKLYVRSRKEFKKEFNTPPKLTLEELITKIGNEEKAKEVYERVVTNFTSKRNTFWQSLDGNSSVKDYCLKNPDYRVFGEAYGNTQKGFNYGFKNGEGGFIVFDIQKPDGTWMNPLQFLETCRTYGINHVPVLHESIPFDFDTLVKCAEGKTLTEGKHIREGVVVTPHNERYQSHVGRIKFKIINPEF